MSIAIPVPDSAVPVPVGDVRVELPVDYRANVDYDVERWAAVAEFGRGFQGKSLDVALYANSANVERKRNPRSSSLCASS